MKTGNSPISNDDRIAWLSKCADYLEHRDADGEEMCEQPTGKGFWLSNVTEDNWKELRDCLTRPDCCALSLIDYIDLMIQREREREAADRRALEEFLHHD